MAIEYHYTRRMFNLSQMRKAFNRAAGTVQQADVLQREITDRLVERLPMIRLQPQRILECGPGTGYLTQQLLAQYPNAELVALDYADQQLMAMPSLSCHKAASYFSSLPFQENTFDMVVSSLRLNAVNDLAACFRECKRVLKPNGLVMFTMLGVETLKELRESFSSCQGFLHLYPDMHDIGDLLLQCGFEGPVMDMEAITIRYKKLNTLFEDFKLSGAGNAHQQRPKGLFGKDRWQVAMAKYDTLKEADIYPATFEIIYGHAWVPQADVSSSLNETSISIDKITMR